MTHKINIAIFIALTACVPPVPHHHYDASVDSSTPTDAGLPHCESNGVSFCAHDNTCCTGDCNSDYTCPVDRVTWDVLCMCQNLHCPADAGTTACEWFTIDRKLSCPCD